MRIEASIRLIGDSLDVAALTRVLGRQPDLARDKGASYLVGRTGRFAVQPTGVWLIRSPLDSAFPISDHTDWCLAQLESLPLDELPKYGVEKIDVFYGVFDDSGNCGFALTPEQMRRFAACGATAGFDVYPHEERP
ncbi:MAG: DUF4279 domain-containing protein [Planctomycetes bacterium]|nr:DUF4279 domain-containing protein [Planctomycetota bacterium]